MSNKQVLPLGLYETLKTRRTLSQELPPETEWVESEILGEDAEHISSLARYVAQQVAAKLEQTEANERIALVNMLLTQLEDESGPDEVFELENSKILALWCNLQNSNPAIRENHQTVPALR